MIARAANVTSKPKPYAAEQLHDKFYVLSTNCDNFTSFLTHTIKQGGHKPGKRGILRDFSEHGNLWNFVNSVQPQGKIVTKCFQFVI